MSKPKVGMAMGSYNDWKIIRPGVDALKGFGMAANARAVALAWRRGVTCHPVKRK